MSTNEEGQAMLTNGREGVKLWPIFVHICECYLIAEDQNICGVVVFLWKQLQFAKQKRKQNQFTEQKTCNTALLKLRT